MYNDEPVVGRIITHPPSIDAFDEVDGPSSHSDRDACTHVMLFGMIDKERKNDCMFAYHDIHAHAVLSLFTPCK